MAVFSTHFGQKNHLISLNLSAELSQIKRTLDEKYNEVKQFLKEKDWENVLNS